MKEIIRETVAVNFPGDFKKAIAVAEGYLSSKPTKPKWGTKWTDHIRNAGYVIGRTTENSTNWWHVDFDEAKKLHINAMNHDTDINNCIQLTVPGGGRQQSSDYLQSFLTSWWFDLTIPYQNQGPPPEAVNNLQIAAGKKDRASGDARNRLAFFRYIGGEKNDWYGAKIT